MSLLTSSLFRLGRIVDLEYYSYLSTNTAFLFSYCKKADLTFQQLHKIGIQGNIPNNLTERERESDNLLFSETRKRRRKASVSSSGRPACKSTADRTQDMTPLLYTHCFCTPLLSPGAVRRRTGEQTTSIKEGLIRDSRKGP